MDILAHIPEVPVGETWEWLSEVLPSYDGSEQRISIRGAFPRVKLNLNLRIIDAETINKQWQNLLVGRGEFLIPEYQYATRIVAASNSGANRVYYEPSYTDIRVGEKVLLLGASFTVTAVHSDGCSITPVLPSALPVGSVVVPLVEGLLEDGTTIDRYAVHEAADVNYKALLHRKRTSLVRPGNVSPLTLWASVPVLDVRPMANNNPRDSIVDSQITIDNKIAISRFVNRWKESKITSSRQYLVNRMPITSCQDDMRRDLDYWRHFLNYCRGSQKKFWLPTYREDLIPMEVPTSGASTILTSGFGFGVKLFPDQSTHKYFEIVTEQGTHRCEVTGVVAEGNNTRCTFTPALPSGWVTIQRISHLIPSRIDDDSVSWEHQGIHSILNINFRTAENE